MPEDNINCHCNPMDTQIFNMNLSVMATSLYILVTALPVDGVKPSRNILLERWNASSEDFDLALTELLKHKILEEHLGPEAEAFYLANPASLWQ